MARNLEQCRDLIEKAAGKGAKVRLRPFFLSETLLSLRLGKEHGDIVMSRKKATYLQRLPEHWAWLLNDTQASFTLDTSLTCEKGHILSRSV